MAGSEATGRKSRPNTGILPRERLGSQCVPPAISAGRALIVTGDVSVLLMCQEALKATPYTVDWANSVDCVDPFRAQPIHLLVVDRPVRDSLEVLERVKTFSPKAVPVILVGDPSVDDLLLAIRNGVVDCIRKPLTLDRLREAVARAAEIDVRVREHAILKAYSPLFDVANDINSSLDLDEVLSNTARHTARLANARASHIVLLDPSIQRFVFRAGHGNRERWEQDYRSIEEGPLHKAISSNQCLSVPNLHAGISAGCVRCAEKYGLRSSVWIPLAVGERPIGAIAACSAAPDPSIHEYVDMLCSLGSYAAAAVERARLYQETKRGLEKLDLLYKINRTVGSSFELDEVMNAILQVESVLPYDSASLFILDEREDVVRMYASRNLDAELQATTAFKVGEGIVGWVAAHAESLSVPNTALDTRYEPRGAVNNPRSILAVPLRAGGRVLAVLNLTRYRVNAFTDEEARLAEMIASQAAQAMRNAQLYQNACNLLQEESALYSLAKIINSSSSTEELLSKVAPLAAETLRAEACIVGMINPSTNRLFLARSVGVPDEYVRQVAETVDDWHIHSQALSSIESVAQVVRRDGNGNKEGSLLLGSWNGLVSVLSTPLAIRQKTLGVITVARRTISGEFLHREKDLLMNMASQVSVGVEELRLRAHDMLTLYELSQFSGTTLNLEEIYKRILNKVEPLFDCEGASLLLYNAEEKRFDLKYALGSSKDCWHNVEKLPPDSLAERLSNARQPLVFASVNHDKELAPWPASHGCSPILLAPMVVEGSIIGILAVRFRSEELPSEDRRVLLASLAVQAALVIRNAKLYAASQELTIGEERNRIAREFHDGVAQSLALLMLKMQLITRLLDIDIGRAKDELERSREILEDSTRELRRCIYALRPVHLEGTGISEALAKIANEFAEQNELEATLDLDSIHKLPSRVEATVFRVAQEALNNIRKHAEASSIEVSLKLNDNYLHLAIVDNGKGFDCDLPPPNVSDHFGVSQMKERARELGGYLEIRSNPGVGTRIEMWIPMGGRG